MRTTLTIDSDVAVVLDRVRAGGTLTLKDVVNEALRRGLRAMESDADEPPAAPYEIPTWNSGGMRISVHDVAEALAWAEGDAHR